MSGILWAGAGGIIGAVLVLAGEAVRNGLRRRAMHRAARAILGGAGRREGKP